MSIDSPVRVMSPEDIVARGGGTMQPLVLPHRSSLFAERSLRLRQLAAGHAMREFLIFMADLAQAQQHALASFPAVPLPDAAATERAGLAGLPPLEAGTWPRDPTWRAALAQIITELRPRAPQAAQVTLDALTERLAHDVDEVERQADRLLNGVMLGLDLAAAPIIAAALQVNWTHLLLELQRLHGHDKFPPIDRIDVQGACPCCGSRPTASITTLAGDAPGQRYLHCSLCSLQWHMVRVQCSHCGSDKGIAYNALEALGAGDATRSGRATVQAEICDTCNHYLKIVHMDRDPHVDPVADDLASVTLDLLVSETGKLRHGVNLMLLFGDPDVASDPDPGGGPD
ncbi:MAG: formate dehydrogenase accessory protein FdhE [Ideonella sp.]